MARPPPALDPQPSQQLMPFAMAGMMSAATYPVTPLGVRDLLKREPKSTRELGRTCAAHEDGSTGFGWRRVRTTKSAVCLLEAKKRMESGPGRARRSGMVRPYWRWSSGRNKRRVRA
jgi:hypothetical protein